MNRWFGNLTLTVFLLSILSGNSKGETMVKNDLRKEILRVEKEKKWRLLSSDFENLEVMTLEDLSLRKWGQEVFRRKDASMNSPAFSPDAKKIAFFMIPKSEDTLFLEGLYLINSDGSNLELINSDFFPICFFYIHSSDGICWSPDGRKIAFVGKSKREYTQEELNSLFIKYRIGAPQGLNVIDLETKKVETLIEDGVWTIYTQAWSNDSKEILYINMDREIMIYNFESKSSRKLTTGDNPSWSRDGKWIVFNPVRFDPITKAFIYDDYCIIHPDGSGKELLIPNKNERFSHQALWSPDNNYLLLSSVGVKRVMIIIPSHEYITLYIMDFRTKKIIKWGEGTVFTSWEGRP